MMELSVLVEFAAVVPHLDAVVVVGEVVEKALPAKAEVAVEVVVEKELLLEAVVVAVEVVEKDAAAVEEEVA